MDHGVSSGYGSTGRLVDDILEIQPRIQEQLKNRNVLGDHLGVNKFMALNIKKYTLDKNAHMKDPQELWPHVTPDNNSPMLDGDHSPIIECGRSPIIHDGHKKKYTSSHRGDTW